MKLRQSFCVFFSCLSLNLTATAMPPADVRRLSQVESLPEVEPKEVPDEEMSQDLP